MSKPLSHKLQKIFEQTVALVLPTAIKSSSPVFVNLNKNEGEPIQDKRGIFIQQFKKSLSEQFANAAKKPEDKKDTEAKRAGNSREELEARISKYSLMDTDLLEAQIMIDRLCNTLQDEHQYDVDCLSMRLERLAGITIERSNNPLTAKHLTTVFHQCCDALQPSKNASDAAMTNWGKALKVAYPQWIKHINQLLIKQHILPRLDMDDVSQRYEKKNQDKAREIRKNLIEDITGKKQDADTSISNEDLMLSIKALVANAAASNTELNKHIVTGTTGGTLATKEDIFEAINSITNTAQVNSETGYRELPEINQSLAEKLASASDMQSKALDTQTQNSISLLSMMFDRLQNEEQIAAPIKPLIDELQAPILKLAVQNQDFFANPDNSAQELINGIAQVGTQWTPKQNISKDPFYKKISSIVDDINASSLSSTSIEQHEEIFEEKLITLKDFLEREKQRSALLEERIIQAESMKARTEAARETAEKTILKKISRYKAPEHTATFLKEYWQHVLFFYINRDDDFLSEEQQKARKTLDDLLIFRAENLDTEFSAVAEAIVWHLHHIGLELSNEEATLKGLRDEFHNSQQSIKDQIAAAAEASAKAAEQEQAAARAAEALSNAVSVVLKRSETQSEPIPTANTQPIEPPPAITQEAVIFETSNTSPSPSTEDDTTFDFGEIITDSLPEIDDDDFEDEISQDEDFSVEDIFDKQADMLRADTWFRLSNATHDKLKIKLAAVIKHNGNYIFVNREGAKIITAKKPEVAELLRCGELEIVDDSIFFDRALESVIQSLRK